MNLPPYRPTAFQRLIQRLAMAPLSSRLLARVLPGLDRLALALSRGRQTATSLLTGLPTLLVETTGAKSGLPRLSRLVAILDGPAILLVASNFGGPSHPAWYHNLRKHPSARVTFQGQTRTYTAREAEGTEAERYLELAASYYPGYRLYRKRAYPRRIPVLVLTVQE